MIIFGHHYQPPSRKEEHREDLIWIYALFDTTGRLTYNKMDVSRLVKTAYIKITVLRLRNAREFCTMLDLQLNYNSRAYYPPLQCLRTRSTILTGAHSYFEISFKCEGKNSCDDLITNPRNRKLTAVS